MAHSHSHNNNNNHHQHRMPKPASLGLSQQNFENLMMGSSRFQNVVPSSSNSSAAQQQVDHSWQTERTLNLDDFDDKDFNLVNYIAADSTTPLEDMGPGLNMDEIDRQKTEATWMQGNYEQIFSEQQEFHHQEHDFVPSNDFASVPNYDEADPEMEMAYQEEIPPSTTPIAHQAFQRAHRNLDKITLTPSTSRASTVHQTLNRMAVKPEIIKEEPSEHQEESFVGLSLTGGGSTSSRASSVTSNHLYTTVISGGIKMSTKPRKYRIKPESEKMNPQYRMKRTKNNDAVRKSREKAKKHQEAKDLRLQQLEEDVLNQSQIIAEQDTQIAQLRNEIGRLKQNCRCGAATGKHRR